MRCCKPEDVVRSHAGVLPEEQAESVRECVQQRGQHRDLHRRLEEITDALRLQPGEADDPDFADEVMTLVRMGRAGWASTPPAPVGRWRRWLSKLRSPLWIPVTAAATTAVVMMVTAAAPSSQVDESGFQARAVRVDSADRWVSMDLFRQTPDGYAPVVDRISADDALAFSYVNRRMSGYQHLAVFAVDEQGRVFWYYPAYDGAGPAPSSISVPAGPGSVTLPDQVRHRLRPGLLRAFAVFSRRPLSVRHVEADVARDLATRGGIRGLHRLGIPDTGQDSRLLVVAPSANRRE